MIYFYCISPETQEDVIRSLVVQLAWTLDGTSIEEFVVSLFDKAKPPHNIMPTLEHWSRALLTLCQRVKKIVIVIDALDECTDFRGLLTTLKELRAKLPEKVKFVFSSRAHVRVDKYFEVPDGVNLSTEDTLEDMLKYLEHEVRSREIDFEYEDETSRRQLSDSVVQVLWKCAGGM